MNCRYRYFLILLMLALVSSLYGQFFSACDCGSEDELDRSIAAHDQHNYRMSQKFLLIYYDQAKLTSDFQATDRKESHEFLEKLAGRRPALVFYAFNEAKGRFCTWLMLPEAPVVSQVVSIDGTRFKSLVPRLHQALGILDRTNNRLPITRNVAPIQSGPKSQQARDEIINELSQLLFPDRIAAELLGHDINSLIIVPVASFGTIPFALLKVNGKNVIDRFSVVIAPGFFVFKDEPQKCEHDFGKSIIFGDPRGWQDPRWNFPPLPGARAEALAVAELFGTRAFVDSAASQARLKALLKKNSDTRLVYLATHGIADFKNPLDSSFVLLSDGLLSARTIEKLPLKSSRPLVVLSACQTGLGKDFDVGTIGLARAWQMAGAAHVVMSLWSIDDESTKHLMLDFIQLAQQYAVDRALQLAMQQAREKYPDPVHWAGFGVFGAPCF